MDEWFRPANLSEAWVGASVLRRRWLKVSLAIFSIGMVVWLGDSFLPPHTLPDSWWVVALGWVPTAGVIVAGIALISLMMAPVPARQKTIALALVTSWADTVHRLPKAALDEFQTELAALVPAPAATSRGVDEFGAVIRHLAAAGNASSQEIVESIAAVDPHWQSRLVHSVRDVVVLEQTFLPKRRYSERLAAASPAIQRRARIGSAFFAVAFVIIFASPLGLIVQGLLGLHSEGKADSGVFVAAAGGGIIAWIGAQLSAVPDNRRSDRLRAIADSLGTSFEG